MSAFSGCQYRRGLVVPAPSVRNASCTDQGEEYKINFLALRRTPPKQHILDKGDILGIYIQGITGAADQPPPVFFPEDKTAQPSLGYPVPIRDDGTISLPLVRPIELSGMTLAQAEEKIREEYTVVRKILKPGSDKIIVTLMRPRKYNVMVIREDLNDDRLLSYSKNETFIDESKSGESFSVELDVYKNDVLHALTETGGMPGEGAKSEIIVLRGGATGGKSAGAIIHAIGDYDLASENTNIVRIPINGNGGMLPELTEADITLNEGDVVYIEGRDREVFYTGGLLDGGRFPLPRDYEIDVLEAISLAGGSASAAAGSNKSGGGIRGTSILPPTRVTILRKCEGKQCVIGVDLRRVMFNPEERAIIKPGDMIILEYRPKELAVNAAAALLQFGGIYRLFD